MKNVDAEAERKRLELVYSGMPADELEQLAGNANSLTELAKAALRRELSRRGSKVELRDAIAEDESARGPVMIRRFRDIPAALLARSVLESAQIECFLSNENTVRMDWLWSNALGGVGLLVREEDALSASELLDQNLPESFPVDGAEEFESDAEPEEGK